MDLNRVVWMEASCEVSASTELGSVPCPVCDGTGRMAMALPIADADDCPACWAAGAVSSDVAPYLLRRQIQAPMLRMAVHKVS